MSAPFTGPSVPEARGRLPLAVGVGCAQNGPATTAWGGWTWAGLLRVRGRGKAPTVPTYNSGPSNRCKVRAVRLPAAAAGLAEPGHRVGRAARVRW